MSKDKSLIVEPITNKDGTGSYGSYIITAPGKQAILATIKFQSGQAFNGNYNGVTEEALLSLLQHRLDSFKNRKDIPEIHAVIYHLAEAQKHLTELERNNKLR